MVPAHRKDLDAVMGEKEYNKREEALPSFVNICRGVSFIAPPLRRRGSCRYKASAMVPSLPSHANLYHPQKSTAPPAIVEGSDMLSPALIDANDGANVQNTCTKFFH